MGFTPMAPQAAPRRPPGSTNNNAMHSTYCRAAPAAALGSFEQCWRPLLNGLAEYGTTAQHSTAQHVIQNLRKGTPRGTRPPTTPPRARRHRPSAST